MSVHNETRRINVLVYVDDLIVASKSLNAIRFVEISLSSKFEMKDLGEIRNYLGMQINKEIFR